MFVKGTCLLRLMRPLPHTLSFTQSAISSFPYNEEGKIQCCSSHCGTPDVIFFPLISTQGRENDKQTHACAHTYTGAEDGRIGLLVTSTFSMDPCGFDLISVTGLYVYCQSKCSANSRSQRPSPDAAAGTERCVSVQINFALW